MAPSEPLEAIVRAPSGYVVLSDARIVGTVDVGMASGGHGEVSLTNVLTLDCSFCHELSQVGDLPWAELLLTPQLNFFCTCDLADERGIRVASADAKLSAAFTISNQLIAHSEWGSMSLSEVVIVPSIASHNGAIGSIGPPTLSCNTTYGNIELNQVIAEASAASITTSCYAHLEAMSRPSSPAAGSAAATPSSPSQVGSATSASSSTTCRPASPRRPSAMVTPPSSSRTRTAM